MKNTLIGICFLLFCSASAAKVQYVDDSLRINLRTGPETTYRIVKSINSGAKVEVLKEDVETKWTKIREPEGVEGWVPSRFLVDQPIARDQLKAALEKLQLLEDKSGSFGARFQNLQNENEVLNRTKAELESQNHKLSRDLEEITAISQNAVNLDNRNRELQEINQQYQVEIDRLQAENQRLANKNETEILLAGGGLICLGLLIALIIPSMKRTRKSDTWV